MQIWNHSSKLKLKLNNQYQTSHNTTLLYLVAGTVESEFELHLLAGDDCFLEVDAPVVARFVHE